MRALLAERDAAIAEREAALAERDAHLLHARFEIEKLKVQLARLRRMQFGQSSERLSREIEQLELRLEEALLLPPVVWPRLACMVANWED